MEPRDDGSVRASDPLRRADLWALLLLTALLLPPRLFALDANSSQEVFRGVLTDEGAWATNARQAALFDRWQTDDHNPGLTMAPVYTGVLRVAYAVAGVGLAQTRAVSAVSGFLACLLVYAVVRRAAGIGPALLAALALGTNYFHLIHNRVALVESLQMLLLLVTAACVVASLRRPGWGIAAGLCFCLAMASKHSASALLPALVLFWALQYAAADRFGLPAWNGRGPAGFGAAAALGLLGLGAAAWLHPAAAADLVGSLRSGLGERTSEFLSVRWLGLPHPALPWSAFLRLGWPLLGLVVVFGAARITGASRSRGGPWEVFCWCWLGTGILFLAMLTNPPDRRFLAVLPPLAILAGLSTRRGALALPFQSSCPPLRRALAGALVGGFAGLIGQAVLLAPLKALADALDLGFPPSLVASGVTTLGWLGGAALALMLPGGWRPVVVPATGLVLAIAGFDLVRFAMDVRQPSFGVRDTSRALAELTSSWDERDRVMVGAEAYTYALETRLVAFTVRPVRPSGVPQNPDGWERFRPALAMTYDDREAREALERGLLPWRSFRPRQVRVRGSVSRPEVRVFVRADLCPGCGDAENEAR